MSCVYALTDLSDGAIRYVGKTNYTHTERLRVHIAEAKRGSTFPVHRWLRKHDLACGLVILEADPEDIAEAERSWIAVCRAAGDRLLNCTDGGEGMTGYRYSEESRAKMSESGKRRPPISDKTRAKLRAARLGKKMSPESRDRLSQARTGMTFSDEHRANLAAAKIGNHNRLGGKAYEGSMSSWR